MNNRAQLRKSEAARPKRLRELFKEARDELVWAIELERIRVKSSKHRVWRFVYIGASARIGVPTSPREIILIPILMGIGDRRSLHLTVDGERVLAPRTSMTVNSEPEQRWAKDLRPLHTYTADELEQMIHGMEFLHYLE